MARERESKVGLNYANQNVVIYKTQAMKSVFLLRIVTKFNYKFFNSQCEERNTTSYAMHGDQKIKSILLLQRSITKTYTTSRGISHRNHHTKGIG